MTTEQRVLYFTGDTSSCPPEEVDAIFQLLECMANCKNGNGFDILICAVWYLLRLDSYWVHRWGSSVPE